MKLIESKAEYIPQEEGLDGIYKMIELWKPVPNYEGLYEVSSKGRIRKLWKNSNKIKSQDTLRGYKKVTLFKNQGSKRVIQYDLNDNFIAEYCSTHDAALKTGFSQSSISMCCTGGYWRDNHTKFIKYKRVHNYKFKFKDEIN